MNADGRPGAAGARWLARMRWGALGVVAASLLLGDRFLGSELPLVPTWTLVAIGAVSNLWLTSRGDRAGALGTYFVLDVLLLTGLLYFSGGPTNPFSIIFIVYIAMSAVMLTPRWTWAVAGLSVVSFGALFVFQVPDAHAGHGVQPGSFQTHLYGMLIAFVLAGGLITYFVSQLSLELRRRERALAEAEERAHRWGKVASIATLAAGAAHELGTPLGTIAVAAHEMERQASRTDGAESLAEDARLIGEEVARCKVVLDRMSAAAGEPAGEMVTAVSVEALFADVRKRLGERIAARWQTHSDIATIVAPEEALAQMVENIARNGFDACESGRVALTVRRREHDIVLSFEDEGVGMDPEALRRATDPFFTTKHADDRMGLGLFLARTLVDSLGGELDIDSTRGHGTTIDVVLPQPA